jgi:hypothetical protein
VAETPLHPALEPLAMLVGEWRGEGRGGYPTVDDFHYREETVFDHVGKPHLLYRQRTWRLPDEEASHGEAGFIRALPDGRIEAVIAHPTGRSEVGEGAVLDGHLEITSTAIVGTGSAKEVTALHRVLDVTGDTLHYRTEMAAVGEPLAFHLEAELHRV